MSSFQASVQAREPTFSRAPESTKTFSRMLAGIVASALLLALYARIDRPWHILGWIVLVPWLGALDRTRSLRGSVLAGAAMATAFVLAVFGWFASAMRAYTGASAAAAMLVLVVLAPLVEFQFLTFAVARHVVRRSGAGRAVVVLAGACVWVGTEWLTGKLFGDTLGHGLYPSPWLRQAADVAGAGGLTLALIVGNECIRAALVSRRATPVLTLGVLVATLAGYGAVRERAIRGAGSAPPLTAGVVQ